MSTWRIIPGLVSSDRITPMCLTHLEGVQKHPILTGQHGTTRIYIYIYNHGKNNHLQSWDDPLSRLMLFFFCMLSWVLQFSGVFCLFPSYYLGMHCGARRARQHQTFHDQSCRDHATGSVSTVAVSCMIPTISVKTLRTHSAVLNAPYATAFESYNGALRPAWQGHLAISSRNTSVI